MAGTAFTQFVQSELPKRPWLAQDLPEESILIRRGDFRMQLDGLQLAENQMVTADADGKLIVVNIEDVTGKVDSFIHTQETVNSEWTIVHNAETTEVFARVTLEDGSEVNYDTLTVVDNNTVKITFSLAIKGKALVILAKQ